MKQEYIWLIVTIIFALLVITIVTGVIMGIPSPALLLKGKGIFCGIYNVICRVALAGCGC